MVGGPLRVLRLLPSSTTKTGRHDIAEILLKVALNTKNQIKEKIAGKTMYEDSNILVTSSN